MDKTDRQRVTVFMDPQVVREAKAASALTGRTLSDVAADAFRAFARQAEQKSATPVKAPR
jgi:hypothetical protein